MESSKLNNNSTESNESEVNSEDGSIATTIEALEKDEKISCFRLFYEWRRCASASSQFHNYYIYGELKECSMEKNRMKNCFKWKTMGKSKDKAKSALIDSYKAEEESMHCPDTPWELRKEPLSDWKK